MLFSRSTITLFAVATIAIFCFQYTAETQATPENQEVQKPDWESTLAQRLPEYGHRNWIVIADSAYPKQSAPGIETVYTGAGQVEVVKEVLKQIKAKKHIRPVIMLDSELASVSEASAPGVDQYRSDLKNLFDSQATNVMKHDDIIRKLDDGAKLFNVLILKTDMTIPYTSVFIELDCGYWNADKEKSLRDLIKQQDK